MSVPLRYRWVWFKKDIKQWFYKTFYGINYHITEGSVLPRLGDNTFASVKRKGSYIDIDKYESNSIIRFIPCVSNFGFFVEFVDKETNIVKQRATLTDTDIRKYFLDNQEQKEKRNE
jgi:hypothetical protein